jgi:hypothetical protein
MLGIIFIFCLFALQNQGFMDKATQKKVVAHPFTNGEFQLAKA